MSVLDMGHGCLVHLPDSRPADTIHARAWEILQMSRVRLDAALQECLEPRVVRIVGAVMADDEAIVQICRTRLRELAGLAESNPQMNLFGGQQ